MRKKILHEYDLFENCFVVFYVNLSHIDQIVNAKILQSVIIITSLVFFLNKY